MRKPAKITGKKPTTTQIRLNGVVMPVQNAPVNPAEQFKNLADQMAGVKPKPKQIPVDQPLGGIPTPQELANRQMRQGLRGIGVTDVQPGMVDNRSTVTTQRKGRKDTHEYGVAMFDKIAPNASADVREMARSYIVASLGGYTSGDQKKRGGKPIKGVATDAGVVAKEFWGLYNKGGFDRIANKIADFRAIRDKASAFKGLEEDAASMPTATDTFIEEFNKGKGNALETFETNLGGNYAEKVFKNEKASPVARGLARVWSGFVTGVGDTLQMPGDAIFGDLPVAGNEFGDATGAQRAGAVGNFAGKALATAATASGVASGVKIALQGGGRNVLRGAARVAYELGPVQNPVSTPKAIQSQAELLGQIAKNPKDLEAMVQVSAELGKRGEFKTKEANAAITKNANEIFKAAQDAGSKVTMKDAVAAARIHYAMQETSKTVDGKKMLETIAYEGEAPKGDIAAPARDISAPKPARKQKPKAVADVAPEPVLESPAAKVQPTPEPVSKPEKPAGKEPWEMTVKEFADGSKFEGTRERSIINHQKEVKEAIRQGKPVPAEVLADYPDLKPKPEVKPAPKPEVKPEAPKATLAEMGRQARADKSLDNTRVRWSDENGVEITGTLREHVDHQIARGRTPVMKMRIDHAAVTKAEKMLERLKNARWDRVDYPAMEEQKAIIANPPRKPRYYASDDGEGGVVLTKAEYDYMVKKVGEGNAAPLNQLDQLKPKIVKGQYRWDAKQKKGIVTLFEGADITTVIHETAHHGLKYVPDARYRIIASAAGVDPEARLEDLSAKDFRTVQEFYARGVEAAIYGEKFNAPKEARAAMSYAAKRFKQIYGDAGVPLPERGKGVLNQLPDGGKGFDPGDEFYDAFAQIMGGTPKAKREFPKAEAPKSEGETFGTSNEAMERSQNIDAPVGQGRSAKDILKSADKIEDASDALRFGESIGAKDIPYNAENAAKAQKAAAVLETRVNEARKALERASEVDRNERLIDFEAAREELNEFAKNIQVGKSEWSDVGRVLQTKVDETGNFAGMQQTLRTLKGSDLTPGEVKRVQEIADNAERYEKEIADLKRQLAETHVTGAAPRNRKGGGVPAARLAKARDFLKDFKGDDRALNQASGDDFADYDFVDAVKDIARQFVSEGAKDLNEVLAKMKAEYPKLAEDDIIDALGSPSKYTLSEVTKRLMRVKAEARMIAGREKALTDQIAKLNAKIGSGGLSVKGRKAPRPGNELLIAQRDELNRQLAKMRRQANRLPELNRQIAELEARIKAKNFDTPDKVQEQKSLDVQRAEANRDALKKQYEQMRRQIGDKSTATGRFVRGAADAIRFTQLGADVGAVLRQGGLTLANLGASKDGLKAASRAIKSEADFNVAMKAIDDAEIGGQLMSKVRKKAGLSLTDAHLNQEEAFFVVKALRANKYTAKIAGRPLERFQTAYLNTLRTRIFDQAYATGLYEEDDMREIAKLINSLTGRSNAKQISEILQVVMTSPRYERSRWEVLGHGIDALNPTRKGAGMTWKRKQLAGTVMSLAIPMVIADQVLKATGQGGVETNPASSDFMKIRIGKNTYDLTAGVGIRARQAMRIAWGWLLEGDGRYSMEHLARTTLTPVSPGIAKPLEYNMGTNLSGYDLDETDKGFMGLLPLSVRGPIKDAQEGASPQKIAVNTALGLAGVSVGSYPKPKRSSTKGPKGDGTKLKKGMSALEKAIKGF